MPNIKIIISISALVFVMFLMVSLFFFRIPTENKDLVNILLGSVVGWVSAIVSFYFGSTERKDRYFDTLQKQTENSNELNH